MSFTINCRNRETVLACFAEGFNCEVGVLVEALRCAEGYNQEQSPENSLYEHIVGQLGSLEQADRIHYFHFTRTRDNNDFSSGLLPLTESLDIIWDTIISCFDAHDIKSNLRQMRESGFESYHYNLKVGEPFHAGPYAMLVKAFAFSPEAAMNHDYLNVPEIVEDICNGYANQFESSIIDTVSEQLSPCIVEFYIDEAVSIGKIQAALYYAFIEVNGLELSWACHSTYDARNETVPAGQIVNVEYVTEN